MNHPSYADRFFTTLITFHEVAFQHIPARALEGTLDVRGQGFPFEMGLSHPRRRRKECSTLVMLRPA